MLRLAADENFNGDIVRGLLRRNPKLDIVRVQDVGLSGADDPSVLQWAADQGRIIVTHDISTLAKHAFDRIAAGQPMPGVFEVRSVAPVPRSPSYLHECLTLYNEVTRLRFGTALDLSVAERAVARIRSSRRLIY